MLQAQEDSVMRFSCVRRMVSLVALTLLAAVALSQLVACNTVKGLGRDVEAMAQGGQDIIDGK
jgi:predicted small secreted protein